MADVAAHNAVAMVGPIAMAELRLTIDALAMAVRSVGPTTAIV